MPNWTESMQQTFEYYIVDPGTWKDIRRLDYVKASTITRDLDAETLGSATIDVNGPIDECYIRIYLVTIQNGFKERHPLGVYIVQSSITDFDGKVNSISLDAYTPLIELKENPPPIGYSIRKGENIMSIASRIVRENVRAPVVMATDATALNDNFVSNMNDTWLTFTSDLINQAKFNFSLDELGRILFAPKQDIASLQPVWTYTDDNSSILQPSISIDKDLYGIPNVVEVIYSKGASTYSAVAINDDSNSPISTVSRGRRITHRVTDVDFGGIPSHEQANEYAKRLLRELSSIQCTVSYTHGYCPVNIGDCVRLNYRRAGLNDVRAKVISQNIRCTSGCQVSEKALFNMKLWG